MDNVYCLNPWDPQSKRQYRIDGVYATLNAGQAVGGQAHGICYCIEGNIVDRESAKNGKGYCEDVSPTLNTQDRHAICFAWANSASAELSVGETSPTIKAANCGEPAICFQQNQREEVRNMGECAGAITAESGMHNTNYVCFQLCGDRDDPSVSVSEKAFCIPANPMSDRGQAVCYETKDI